MTPSSIGYLPPPACIAVLREDLILCVLSSTVLQSWKQRVHAAAASLLQDCQ